MITKPHYRLRRLIDCPDGTRFYTRTTFNPYTLITKSPSRFKIWVHQEHGFMCGSCTWKGTAMGWVAV